MEEAIRQRVRAHDKYQVEFKLDYPLLPQRRTRYQITTYIFVPSSLAIRSDTYSKTEFYRDVQNYVRLQTPLVPLHELRCATDSPLLRLQQLVDSLPAPQPRYAQRYTPHQQSVDRQIVNCLKFMRTVLRSSLRLELRLIRRIERQRIDTAARVTQFRTMITNAIQELHAILDHFRELGAQLRRLRNDPQIQHAYRLADESISLVVEEFLVNLFRLVSQTPESTVRAEFEQQIEAEIEAEIAYRQRVRYPALLHPDSDNELFLNRASTLKKYASSVLYLSLTIHREGTALEHVLFALAAGLSMIFATVVAFYFQGRYGYFTFPVFAALVVGYMFKDRIKETGRTLFAHVLRRFLFDRRVTIRTLDGKRRLGFLREKVTFVENGAIPANVLAVRNRRFSPELDVASSGENVICYTKEVVLHADAFRQIATGGPAIAGVNDIMRHDIRPYLRKMDDPYERRYYVKDGKLSLARCHRVYYLNVVTLYTSEGKHHFQRLERTRIALTRKGIERIEQFA